jgi:hypothetical protein
MFILSHTMQIRHTPQTKPHFNNKPLWLCKPEKYKRGQPPATSTQATHSQQQQLQQ